MRLRQFATKSKLLLSKRSSRFAGAYFFTFSNNNIIMQPFLGQIMAFAGNFAPKGWAFCHGQLLPINQNQALFSLLGTTYGGNGQTNFALPDLRNRTMVGFSNDRPLGGVNDFTAAASGESVLGAGTTNYVIALQGIYPSEN
jgi:microcystin-dependent protein